MLDKPVFDPGFAFFVYPLEDTLNSLYQEFSTIKNPKTRKFKFQMYHFQIISIVKNNVAFYLGCLMWAKYLKENMPDMTIENNSFFNVDLEKENISQEHFCSEINFLLNYFEKYNKDCKFYLGKDSKLSEKWLNIANTYKAFLLLNNSFTKTEKTNDIILPTNINEIIKTSNEENKELITNALESQNLSILLSE